MEKVKSEDRGMTFIDDLKRFLCRIGIHWSGTIDGGCMGDGRDCDICGLSTYRSILIIRKRSLNAIKR